MPHIQAVWIYVISNPVKVNRYKGRKQFQCIEKIQNKNIRSESNTKITQTWYLRQQELKIWYVE